MIALYYSSILVQMTKPSLNKKTMEYNKKDPYLVFPPSSISSNFDNIRDTEIGHVDLTKFLKRIEQPPFNYKMEPTINNDIHLVSTLPMSNQDPKVVLVTTNHFDPIRRSVKDTNRKKLIRLDKDFFDTIFKCPNIEKYYDITMQSSLAYYDKNSNKCK